MLRKLITLTAALTLALSTGCGNQMHDICSASTQCEGGNDRDVNACVAIADGAEQVAMAYDCGDAYNKFVDCIETTSSCNTKHYTNTCDQERNALAACEKAASGK